MSIREIKTHRSHKHRQLQISYDKQLEEVDKMLEQMYKMLNCTLTTIPGVNTITAVKILAEIGDIKRFGNADKLAQLPFTYV